MYRGGMSQPARVSSRRRHVAHAGLCQELKRSRKSEDAWSIAGVASQTWRKEFQSVMEHDLIICSVQE